MSVRLFVGNIPYDVTEAELSQLFSGAGTPSVVRLPRDRETGKPRGFAFVEFDDRGEAEEAIRRLNQTLFKGRPLSVSEARAREEGPGGKPRGAPDALGSGELAPPQDLPAARPPKRNFGPDAPPRGKRKPERRGPKAEERGSKGPQRERTRGRLSFDPESDDADEDGIVDDFGLWAQHDSKDRDEE